MGRFKQGCLYGCMGGCGLYIAEFFCSVLPYMKVSSPLFEIWLITSIIIGIAISVLVLLYKKPSLLEMIFRFAIMEISYIIIVIVNGYVGIRRFLCDFFAIKISPGSNNVSGMITVTFLFIVFCICIVVMVIVAISSLFNKIIQNHRLEQNEDLLMKKENIISILDGILRVFIVMVTCNSLLSAGDKDILLIIIGTIISCFSLIYTYKNNIGRVGISYFFSILTEFFLIGFEIYTGIVGRIINVLVPIRENDFTPGDSFLLMGYLLGVIIITASVRIVLGIIEFIRWYKD